MNEQEKLGRDINHNMVCKEIEKEWDKLIKISVVVEQDGHRYGREYWISPDMKCSDGLLNSTIIDLGKAVVRVRKEKRKEKNDN